MNEFQNRIDAQRSILGLVNKSRKKEDLFGLSKGAIDRWILTNELDPSSNLVRAVYRAAEKLFFLGNKSQEQVTDEYRLLSAEVAELTRHIQTLAGSA
jgi:hypothetical protein